MVVFNARRTSAVNMNRTASACMRWMKKGEGRVRRGTAPATRSGKEGKRKMINISMLEKDITAIREKVESYEVVASSFDDDFSKQRDVWMKKVEFVSRLLEYLLKLREYLVEREDDGK